VARKNDDGERSTTAVEGMTTARKEQWQEKNDNKKRGTTVRKEERRREKNDDGKSTTVAKIINKSRVSGWPVDEKMSLHD
jgi:hypothetical protein